MVDIIILILLAMGCPNALKIIGILLLSLLAFILACGIINKIFE